MQGTFVDFMKRGKLRGCQLEKSSFLFIFFSLTLQLLYTLCSLYRKKAGSATWKYIRKTDFGKHISENGFRKMGSGKRVLRNGFKSVRKSGGGEFYENGSKFTGISERKIQKRFEAIIREAWHYDDLCSHKTACKLARVFLSSCLANQTYTRVAEIDGKPAGIIMAKNIEEHHAPLRYRIRQWRAILSVMLSKEGRKVSGIFGGVNDIDKALLAEAQTQYQGEVAFFAVSSSVRGKRRRKDVVS